MTQYTTKVSGKDQAKRQSDAGDDYQKMRSYDEALDEAVEETFPASDPISPSVAEKADRQPPKDKSTGKPGQDKASSQKK